MWLSVWDIVIEPTPEETVSQWIRYSYVTIDTPSNLETWNSTTMIVAKPAE